MTRSHHCHATGCNVEVPPQMMMCKRHWFMLPRGFRSEIWRTYRDGQCDDWQISHEYAEAARKCVRYIAAIENREPDTSVYDMLDPGPPKPDADLFTVDDGGSTSAT